MIPSYPRRVQASIRGGFSLVEVTLAIGIISVSLLSLIAVLPTGLGSLRGAMDETVHAQILQRVSAELVTGEFANLAGTNLTFDVDGQKASGGQAYYEVKVSQTNASVPGQPNLAGHLRRMSIRISRAGVTNGPVAQYALQVAAN